jgi:hypothetical protein
MTVVLKVNMKKLEREECLCKCCIWLFEKNLSDYVYVTTYLKTNMKNLRVVNVNVNVTYDCCSQSEYEKAWEMSECLCDIWLLVLKKMNMKKLEWEECLCKCYIWLLFSKKWIWKNLNERNVYVNVTYDCCSQSECEKTWTRGMFM